MHEIVRRLDVDFIVRSGTVDIDNLNWMGGSIFLKTALAFGLIPDDVAFDFGAHIGSFALPLVQRHRCRALPHRGQVPPRGRRLRRQARNLSHPVR